MALGDYILCCKCDVKLIYDGDKGNRKWWEERFGAEPAILCPKCDKREWVGLTDEDLKLLSAEWRIVYGAWMDDFARDIEAKLKEKNA